MNHEVIVTCAVTGAGDTVGRHPAIPVTPKQIAEAAIEAARAGATVAHCHVRDPATASPAATWRCTRSGRAYPRKRHRRDHQPHRRHGRRPGDRQGRAAPGVRCRHRPGRPAGAAQACRGAAAGNLHPGLRHPQFRRRRLHLRLHPCATARRRPAHHRAGGQGRAGNLRYRPPLVRQADAQGRAAGGSAVPDLPGHSLGARRPIPRP